MKQLLLIAMLQTGKSEGDEGLGMDTKVVPRPTPFVLRPEGKEAWQQ